MRILAIIFILILVPDRSLATTCWITYVDQSIPLSKRIEQADLSFTGEVEFTEITVVSVKGYEKSISRFKAKFTDVFTLDGNKHQDVILESNGHCSCTYNFEVGVKYVILADRITDKGSYYLRSCQNKYTADAWEILNEPVEPSG